MTTENTETSPQQTPRPRRYRLFLWGCGLVLAIALAITLAIGLAMFRGLEWFLTRADDFTKSIKEQQEALVVESMKTAPASEWATVLTCGGIRKYFLLDAEGQRQVGLNAAEVLQRLTAYHKASEEKGEAGAETEYKQMKEACKRMDDVVDSTKTSIGTIAEQQKTLVLMSKMEVLKSEWGTVLVCGGICNYVMLDAESQRQVALNAAEVVERFQAYREASEAKGAASAEAEYQLMKKACKRFDNYMRTARTRTQ